jgi:hypothetical protein
MAGGQALTSGQGSVTQSESVALTGSEITSAQYYVGVVTLGGSAVTAAAGDVAKNRLHPLRSRKVGSGQASFTLVGQAVSAALGNATPAASPVLSGTAITPSQGAFGKDGSRALTGQAATSAQTTIGPPPGGTMVTLTLHPTVTGTLPYLATAYPAEGTVPAGQILISNEDANLRSSVLSTWPGGSASVVVIAGQTAVVNGTPKTITLKAGAGSGANLTTANIASLVSSVSVNCGATGSGSLSTFTSPEKTWWANPQVICCRYRINIDSTLTAVIDIHAFADRAFVEVVLENSLVAASAASITKPSNKAYGSATISVNGSTIATVGTPTGSVTTTSGNFTWEGGHAPFRAFYTSTWIGGDPGIEVTHDTAAMYAHPLLIRCDQATSVNLATFYGSDVYEPWSIERQRMPGMSGGGDHGGIGYLTQWDARYVQSGDKNARRASIASALAALSAPISTRSSENGGVPTFTQIGNKNLQNSGGGNGAWASHYVEPCFDTSGPNHDPAVGLVAFLCRPSPVFIELAQKIAVFNKTYNNPGYGAMGSLQVRGRAWYFRDLAHAIFLTPDADAWKSSAKTGLAAAATWADVYRTDPKAILNFMWWWLPGVPDPRTDLPGFTFAMFEHYYLVQSMHAAARAQLLTGSQQTTLDAATDFFAICCTKYVNDSVDGKWRYHPYNQSVGRDRSTIDSAATWSEQIAWQVTGGIPPDSTGTWLTGNSPDTNWSTTFASNTAGANYPSYFWAALCCAVERGVSGADAAWSKVINGITNLTTWRTGHATDPRWGYWPRNKSQSIGWGSGALTGSYNSSTYQWTPGVDSNGVVNQVSWNLLPLNTWVEVVGTTSRPTRIDALDTVVKGTHPNTATLAPGLTPVPTWYDAGGEDWLGVIQDWNGMAYDDRAGTERLWMCVGGGHAGSSNDGIYKFDLRKMTWQVQRMPMNPQNWSTRTPPVIYANNASNPFYNTYTVYNVAWDYWLANPTSGYFYDEFFDPDNPSDPNRSPRTPTSRHTYGSQVFVPTLGAAGKILMGCRRHWEYDLATNTWATPKSVLGNANPGDYVPSENMQGWWDASRGRYYLQCGNGSGSNDPRSYWHSPSAGTWGTDGPWSASGYTASYCGTELVGGTTLYSLLYHTNEPPYAVTNRPKRLITRNIVTQAAGTTQDVTLGSSLATRTFPGDNDDVQQFITFVPQLNKFFCGIKTVEDGYCMATIDATTLVAERMTYPGKGFDGTKTTTNYRIENRVRYIAGLNAVVWVERHDEGVRIMRVA